MKKEFENLMIKEFGNPWQVSLDKKINVMCKDFEPSKVSKEKYEQIIETIKHRMSLRDLDIIRKLMDFYTEIEKEFENLSSQDKELFLQLNQELAADQEQENK